MKLKENLSLFNRRHSSNQGALSTAAVAIVIAVVLLLNLLMAQLPTNLTEVDISDNGLYTVSDVSVEYLAKLEKQIDLIVTDDKDNVDPRIQRFLTNYAALSDKINLEYIDPTLYPSVLSKYETEQYCIVVHCQETGRTEQLYLDSLFEFDEYYYYYYGSYVETAFDGEGLITACVQRVLSDVETTIYTLTGHGESALPTSVSNLLVKSSMVEASVNLLLDNGVPEEAQVLVCYAPTSDLSETEAEMLKDYFHAGGHLVLLMAASDVSLPVLENLLGYFGMQTAAGYVVDGERYYQQNPYAFFPEINTASELAAGVKSDALALVYNARGLLLGETAAESIAVSSFMTTSAQAFAVTEDSQVQNTYVIGAVAEEESSSGRFTVFSAATLLAEDVIDYYTILANTTLFLNSLAADLEGVETLAINSVSMDVTYNTITSAGVWSVFYVVLLPLAVLVLGLVHWLRRRKL